MQKRVLVSLVTYNSAPYLEAFFSSLAAQTETHCELLITDNNSTDESAAICAEWIPKLPFPATLNREATNTGFAPAHNAHIRAAIDRRVPFILVINPDIVLDSHAIEMLVAAASADEKIGSVCGKLMQLSFVAVDGRVAPEKQTVIDSTGIVINRARAAWDRGHGEVDCGQYSEGAVFGCSGACALYRVRALAATAVPLPDGSSEYFDENFFSYKEDVDLAWRLQLFGWSAWYTPRAIGWHHRTMGRERRSRVPERLRALSWRNHLLLLFKNDDRSNTVRHFPLIFARECAKMLWILGAEWGTLSALPTLPRLWNTMQQKRRWIQEHRLRSPKEMRALLLFRSSSSTTKPKAS